MKKLIAVVAVLAVMGMASTAMATDVAAPLHVQRYPWWGPEDVVAVEWVDDGTYQSAVLRVDRGGGPWGDRWSLIHNGHPGHALQGSLVFDKLGTGSVMSLSPGWTDIYGNSYPAGVGIWKNWPKHELDVAGIVNATAFLGDGSGLTGVSVAAADVVGLQAEINALLPITIADVTLLQGTLTGLQQQIDLLNQTVYGDEELEIEALVGHKHAYLTGWGEGHNNVTNHTSTEALEAVFGPRGE